MFLSCVRLYISYIYTFIYLLLYVVDVSKVMDKTCLICVSWTELLKDFGQLNANVMKASQLEIS